MKLNVKFMVINEATQGVSRSTGLPWVCQSVVVAWDELRDEATGEVVTQRLACRLHGAEVERLQRLCPVLGLTVVPVDIRFRTDTVNNRVINDVRLWLADRQ